MRREARLGQFAVISDRAGVCMYRQRKVPIELLDGLIVRCLGNSKVEGSVTLHVPFKTLALTWFAKRRDQLFQHFDIDLGPPSSRKARGLGFQNALHFQVITNARSVDPLNRFGGINSAANVSTVPLTDIQHSGVRQHPYGFPNGVTPNVQRFREFRLCGDSIAYLPTAISNLRPKDIDCRRDERTAIYCR